MTGKFIFLGELAKLESSAIMKRLTANASLTKHSWKQPTKKEKILSLALHLRILYVMALFPFL